MKLIYKPFGIIIGLSSALLSRRLFDFIWEKLDDEDPPKATTEYSPLPKVIAAAALQGVVFKTTRAVVDRSAARGFANVTGTWPGERTPDPK